MNGSPSRSSAWLSWAQQPREQGGLGLAPHQAAGVVGNLVKESGDDLPAWGPTGDNRTAWGTAQWREDRLRALQQMYPDSYQTMESQQAFMRHELDTTHNKAYKALQAARTPEEAATAFNRLYEVSADNTGGREAAARRFMDQFGGGAPAGPGALTSSFAPTESKGSSMPTPALSADEVMGPGALGSVSQDKLSTIGQALAGMGSSLAGISNPDQAKVLAAQSAAMQKQAVDHGTWSVQTDPNGNSYYFNNKSGRSIPRGNVGKAQEDEYEKAAKIAGAKSNQDYGDSIASAGANANGLAGDVATLKQVYSNPAVYQGQGGEWVQSARKLYAGITGDTEGAKNIADGDIAKALSNKLALKLVQDTGSGKLLPGSFSDSDREFVKQMTTSLNNSPEANQRLIAIYERTVQRAQEAELARQAHLDTNGGIYRPTIRGEIGQLNKKWADEDKARGEAEAKAPAAAAAPAKANTNTFKTKSGVTWSVP